LFNVIEVLNGPGAQPRKKANGAVHHVSLSDCPHVEFDTVRERTNRYVEGAAGQFRVSAPGTQHPV
jgi:hypothetical protein